jgi:hypothetical protein
MIASASAAFTAHTTKPMPHTPASDASSSTGGLFHCDAPNRPQGPPRYSIERAISPVTHAAVIATTAKAAERPRPPSHATHPHGIHESPRTSAMGISPGPTFGTSQWAIAMKKPVPPHHARIPASRAVGAANTRSSRGTSAT